MCGLALLSLGSMKPVGNDANIVGDVHEEERAKLVLRQLPDSQAWNLLGMMSLRIIRFNDIRYCNIALTAYSSSLQHDVCETCSLPHHRLLKVGFLDLASNTSTHLTSRIILQSKDRKEESKESRAELIFPFLAVPVES